TGSAAGGDNRKARTMAGLRLTAVVMAASLLLIGVVLIGARLINGRDQSQAPDIADHQSRTLKNAADEGRVKLPPENINPSPPPAEHQESPPPAASKSYRLMRKDEQTEFVRREARRISMMVGNRPCGCTEEVIGMIKRNVDAYASRAGNRSTKTWGEDLSFLFKRASRFAPLIIRSFNQEKVSPTVGLYIAMIESE